MNGQMIGSVAVVVPVPELVNRAMHRVEAAWAAAARLPHRTHAENLVRCERLAAVEERRARWWGVLGRWTYSPAGTVPLVFGTAVMAAHAAAENARRFWIDSADYYRWRVAGVDPDEQCPGRWSA